MRLYCEAGDSDLGFVLRLTPVLGRSLQDLFMAHVPNNWSLLQLRQATWRCIAGATPPQHWTSVLGKKRSVSYCVYVMLTMPKLSERSLVMLRAG
jgi:hypothetical protein